MNILTLRCLSIYLLVLLPNCFYAQTLVNQEWVKTMGTPSTNYNYQISVMDSNDNLIVVGNTFTPGEDANFLIVKYDRQGNTIWQKEFNNTSNGKDYAAAVFIDEDNNVYVTGTSENGTDFDYLTVKYNSSGTLLWSVIYDSGYGDDLAGDLVVDTDGSVFITGVAMSDSDLNDYMTIKYNGVGVSQWTTRYDHKSYDDGAAAIIIDGNDVIVTGASADTPTAWDYATVRYTKNTGTQIDLDRTSTGLAGFDQPTDIEIDASGNIYITGSATANGTNYDVQTVKIDANHTLVWSKLYDLNGEYDKGYDVEVDANGNVYVVGYGGISSTSSDYLILKYDTNGTIIWTRRRPALDGGFAKAKQLLLDGKGLFVAGESSKNGQADFYTTRYYENGDIQWEKYYDSGYEDVALSMNKDENGDVYVIGKSSNGTLSEYNTIKYENFERAIIKDPDSINNPLHVSDEVIVRFLPRIVDVNFVNDGEKRFGKLGDVITDATAISQMKTALGAGEDFSDWKVIKIFPQLTTSHISSTSRLGKEVKIPQLWSAFILRIPQTYGANPDEIGISDDLSSSNLAAYIKYAESNYIGEFTIGANDIQYTSQHSLQSSSPNYPGHINIEGAWDYETGKDFVKVGIYDSGINWSHEDFDIDLGNGNPTSKIVDGYDFETNTILTGNPLPSFEHGTPVAGIVGALRNNTVNGQVIGVAGIAGGNMTLNNSNDPNSYESTGATLYDIKIGNTIPSFTAIVNALLDGALSTNQGGFELNIINMSLDLGSSYSQLLAEAVQFVYESEVTLVASRGNDPDSNYVYPATFNNDKWVISVGASNRYGNRWNYITYDNQGNIDGEYGSSYGRKMDLMAPGAPRTQNSITPGNYPWIKTLGNSSNTAIVNFAGTSAAAPHVTGVISLLQSYLNNSYPSFNNLAPEDGEKILELTAKDMPLFPINPGYDAQTGWGLLDATTAFNLIDKTNYSLLHLPEMGGTSSFSTSLPGTSFTIPNDDPNLQLGSTTFSHIVLEPYTVTITYNHQNYIPSGVVIHNFWQRNSGAKGFLTLENQGCNLVYHNSNEASFTAKIYKITGGYTNYPNGYMPWSSYYKGISQYQISCPYTLRTDDFLTTSTTEVEKDIHFSIYPNPTEGNIWINYNIEKSTEVRLEVIHLNGQIIQSQSLGFQNSGTYKKQITTSNLPTGVYFLQLNTNENSTTQKFIKIN